MPYLAILLTLALIFAACGGGDDAPAATEAPAAAGEEAVQPAAEPEPTSEPETAVPPEPTEAPVEDPTAEPMAEPTTAPEAADEPSETGTEGSIENLTAQLDAFLQSQVYAEGGIPAGAAPGVVLLVDTPDGRYLQAAGVSNMEDGTPMQVDDRLEIGSNSKSFTIVLLMQLIEEGVLSLEDPLSKWLPEQAAALPNGDQMTLHQLAQHTTGVWDYADDIIGAGTTDPEKLEQSYTPDELVQYAIDNGTPDFAPGEEGQWKYSNTGYILLGMVIEAASGEAIGDLYQSRIFDPLGLETAVFIEDVPDAGEITAGYWWMDDGDIINTTDWNVSQGWAAGGIAMTAEDLLTYAKALSAGELFKDPDSLTQMLTFDPNGGDAENRARLVRNSKAFHRLPIESIAEAIVRLERIPVKAGEEIVTQGEPGDAYYIIEEGQAEVWELGIYDDEPKMVNELGKGEAFGEEALVMEGSRSATVRMTEDGSLLMLNKQDFDHLLKKEMVDWVDAGTAKSLVDHDHVLLDVRYEEEYEESYIPGSLLIPLQEIRQRYQELDPEKSYVAYCKGGKRSAVACMLLNQHNLDVSSLTGGIMEWPYDVVKNY